MNAKKMLFKCILFVFASSLVQVVSVADARDIVLNASDDRQNTIQADGSSTELNFSHWDHALIRFELSDVSLNSDLAILRLYYSGNQPATISVLGFSNDAWSENDVVRLPQSGFSWMQGSYFLGTQSVEGEGYVEFDVSAYIIEQLQDGVASFEIMHDQSMWLPLNSKEGLYQPQLQLSSVDSGGNLCSEWQGGHSYQVGDVVNYQGDNYIAEYDNPGYVPTISTWFWEPTTQQCDTPVLADCGTTWYSANLTHYTSYPEPGSDECLFYNGCTWSGLFFGLELQQSREWVERNNIVAVHSKDWDWLGMKTLRLKQGDKQIEAVVYDLCSDTDCNNCCTNNLGGNGFLVDMEENTMQRFGSGAGLVDFQVCEIE